MLCARLKSQNVKNVFKRFRQKKGGVQKSTKVNKFSKIFLFCRGFSKPNFNDTNVKTTASDPKFCADFKKVRFLIVGPTIVPENYDFVQAAVRQNTDELFRSDEAFIATNKKDILATFHCFFFSCPLSDSSAICLQLLEYF